MADMPMSCRFNDLSDGEVIAISSAVIRLAVEDYLRLKRFKYPRKMGHYYKLNWQSRKRMMGEIEDFFNSPWGDTLSMNHGADILRQLNAPH